MGHRPLDDATTLNARLDALEAEQQAARPRAFPLAALFTEAKSELDRRRRKHPTLIRQGSLSVALAAHRLALQQAICALISEVMAAEKKAAATVRTLSEERTTV